MAIQCLELLYVALFAWILDRNVVCWWFGEVRAIICVIPTGCSGDKYRISINTGIILAERLEGTQIHKQSKSVLDKQSRKACQDSPAYRLNLFSSDLHWSKGWQNLDQNWLKLADWLRKIGIVDQNRIFHCYYINCYWLRWIIQFNTRGSATSRIPY